MIYFINDFRALYVRDPHFIWSTRLDNSCMLPYRTDLD